MGLINTKKRSYSASFEAKEERLSDIREHILRLITGLRFTQKERTGILLAIEEACTNVIRHAYLYGPGEIRIVTRITPGKVGFEIIDTGRVFDFDSAGSPDLDRYVKTSRKGGLGLYLIRKIMDEVDYHSSQGENHLRLVKYIPRKRAVAMRLMMMDGVSIRKKFAIWMTAILTGLVFLIYFYFENRTTAALKDNFFLEMRETSTTVARQAREEIVNYAKDAEFFLLAKNFRNQHEDINYVVITDGRGDILANSEDIASIHTSYYPPEQLGKLTPGMHRYSLEGRDYYHFIEPVFENNPDRGLAHIGYTTTRLNDDITGSRRSIFIIAVISYAMSILAIILLSNYFVKPIQKLTEGVRKIDSGDTEMRLPVDGVDEFSEIARAFNEMTGKIKVAQKKIVEQERMQKEMQVAQEIQHTLLPKHFPDIEGYDISTIYSAAKDVGGDYFDFVWIDENTLGIVVADVSGKGVPGSLVMTMIRTAIRLEARGNRSAVDILSRVNDFVTDDVKKGMFVTIFLVVLDSVNRKISFASAGHNPMVLYRKEEDKSYFLNPRGIPLGITLPEELSFSESIEAESIRLKKDDILIIYTDGITEAMNPKREQYGMSRFLQFIKTYSFLTPEEFTEKLNEDIQDFTQNAPQYDDITLVAIKEKVMADDYLVKRRKELLDLVEVNGMPVKDACREMKVSTTTYYKYKKRYELHGEEGLKNKAIRSKDQPRQLSYEDRTMLLKMIKENPEFGTTRLKKEIEARENGNDSIDEHVLYDELVRLRLNTKRLRLEFASRSGKGLTDEQKELLEKESEKYQAKIEKDKQEYLKQLEAEKLEKAGKSKISKFFDNLVSAGIPESEISDMMGMFSDLKENVDENVLFVLLDKMSRRVSQIELDMSKNRVLDQSRFKGLDLAGWKKVADTGIDLNLLDNEGESDSFSFEDLTKRLEQNQNSEND